MTEDNDIERDAFQDMYDAEEDMYAMELELSQNSEYFNPGPEKPTVAAGKDVRKPKAGKQNEPCKGEQKPELAYGIPQDGSLCWISEEEKLAREMEELALAEPEPPEDYDVL